MRIAPFAAALLVALAPAANAAQTRPPRVSPTSSLSQDVGVCQVTVKYSRPSVRERVIWGELVPWGEVWRTGANEATTITFSHDALVQGEPILAGTYALFTIPRQDSWTLIFSRNSGQWGEFSYDPAQDALRVDARPREADHQESLEITFPVVGTDTVRVELHWEQTAVPFDVTFDVRKAAIGAARKFVQNATPADGNGVWNWANYFYQNDFNTAEALRWATDLASSAPMYFTYALEARLLAANGRTEEAIERGRRALAKAGEETGQPGVAADAEALEKQVERWQSPDG